MGKYLTANDLAAKISWEGGAADFIFGYGINPADLPDDLPQEVMGAIIMLTVATGFCDTIDEWVAETLEGNNDDE